MTKDLDCVVCGSCVVDVLVRPVPLHAVIEPGQLVLTEPLELATGGIVSNAGAVMARMGLRVAACTYVGDDFWAEYLRRRYPQLGIDAEYLITLPDEGTSTSAVLVDSHGERSFLHAVGAPRRMDKQMFLERLPLFARSRAMLLGYYPLLPNLLPDLPEVLAALQGAGCLTALDAAGDGGDLEPLRPSLPYLDLYVPSWQEARRQTGCDDPQAIVAAYRAAGARGIVGVKLGRRGALLSSADGRLTPVAAVAPPGPVVDSTGAGDSFLGGLLTGLLRGMSLEDAGRLAAAAGACCVTGLGASAGIRDFSETARLAGIGV
jgi:sugar/nucleoside kinase (ribokinase family)